MRETVLALVGPTAAGKSALALEAAPALDAEIVSLDSTMIYRGMDIGTDKPSAQDRARVPHHLVDVAEPSETMTVAEFQALARAAIRDVVDRGGTPLLVGGSGLYFRAVVDRLEFPGTDPAVRVRIEHEAADVGPDNLYRRLEEIDPAAAARIEPANTRRIVRALEVIEITGRRFSSFRTAWDVPRSIYDLVVVGLTHPRPELDRRINARVDAQMARGLLQEVEELEAVGFRESLSSVQALGYAQMLAYLDGRLSLDVAIEETKRRTRHLARRQLSWFRADPRVLWFDSDPQGLLLRLMSEAAAPARR